MTDGSVIVAIVGVGVALLVGMLGVLLPVVRSQGAAIRRELDQVRSDVAAMRGDLAEVRGELRALTDRVARIEGALTGPHAEQSPRSWWPSAASASGRWDEMLMEIARDYDKSRLANALTRVLSDPSEQEPTRED